MSTATKAKRSVRRNQDGLRAFPARVTRRVSAAGKVNFRKSPLFGLWKDRAFDVQKFVRELREERHRRLFGNDALR